MEVFPVVSALLGATDPGPPVTELVPVRVHAHDPSWPPILVFFVAVAVLGGLIAAIVFLQRARGAGRPVGHPFDG